MRLEWPGDYVNKIICGDCLEVMKEMPDECVDLTITSPPYNLGDDHHTGSKRHRVYSDSMNEVDYQKWQIKVLNELFRITKKCGSLFYNHKNRIGGGVSTIPYQWIFKTRWITKQEIVWWNGGQNFDNIRFYPQTERLYWLVKNPRTVLNNPISLLDIWHIAPVGTRYKHTRQFPNQIVTNILNCFPDAKVILDPFLGSGTVAEISNNFKRNFIGIEINPDYCKIAEESLAQGVL